MNESLARYAFEVGDTVCIRRIPPSAPMEVIDCSDKSLLVLQAPTGAVVRVGRRAVQMVERAGED